MIQMKLDQVIPKDGNPQRSSHHFSLKMNVCAMKVVKRTHGKIEKLIKCVAKNADQSIRAAAQRKQDYKLLGKMLNGDLIAREAHYHTSCRKNYTKADDRHERCDKDERVVEELNAHQNAFDYISSYIEDNLINGCTAERMTILKERYLQFMYENNPSVYNSLYKTSKLKLKLMRKIGSPIKFWQPNYKSELVYSSEIPHGQAIEAAFEVAASESKRAEEAALVLRRIITEIRKESAKRLSANNLLCEIVHSAPLLENFLSILLTGKQITKHQKRKSNQLVHLHNIYARQ